MFTGIIEVTARVESMETRGSNKHFCLSSGISNAFKVDQSVSHNGVCLTVTRCENGRHWVTAVDETLQKSNLGMLGVGDLVNIERCMLANGRFDGHIVQGHVDQTGVCTAVTDKDGSWIFEFEYDPSQGNVTVEKGSIAINGVSLTCFNSRADRFSVAIIPFTFQHTNFQHLKKGGTVNLEFDILGKYIKKLMPQGQPS